MTGALVDDVRGGRVADVLVSPDVAGDGEDPARLQLGEHRRRDEPAHAHRRPPQPGELLVHLVEVRDLLGSDAGRGEAAQVGLVRPGGEVGDEPGEDVAPDRLVTRRVGAVVLRSGVATQVRGQPFHRELGRCGREGQGHPAALPSI